MKAVLRLLSVRRRRGAGPLRLAGRPRPVLFYFSIKRSL